MFYTKEDLKELIDSLDMDPDVIDYRFGYTDPKTLKRKISGQIPLTPRDQTIIMMLSDRTDPVIDSYYKDRVNL